MKIDTFKDINFYKQLEKNVNPIIISALNKHFYFDEGFYFGDTAYDKRGKTYLISWFDPNNLYKNTLPQPYNDDIHFRTNKKFNLQVHYPTYSFLYLVNTLYSEQKDVLIEDVCCGIGRTEIYLKYLGFTNFHLIDNFSQIKENDLYIMLNEAKIECKINQINLNPIISYISAFPNFPGEINDSIEFFCHYTNPRMIENLTPILKHKGFVYLCTDSDNLMMAWCKTEKHEMFKNKIKYLQVK